MSAPLNNAGIKWSNLPQATVPLAGSELTCLVQGGISKQAPVSALGGGGGGTVTSVNAQTGVVVLSSANVGAVNIAATILTVGDETAAYPNSRVLVPGTNVTFDDSTPGQRVVSASSGSVVVQRAAYGFLAPGGGGILTGFNIDSVDVADPGVYTVDYTSAGFTVRPSVNAIAASVTTDVNDAVCVKIRDLQITSCRVQFRLSDNTPFDPPAFCFQAFGHDVIF